MKSTNIYLLSFLTCLLLGLNSCSQSSVIHWIENPTDQDITVALDGVNIAVPAKSGIDHEFEYGRHTMTYDGNSVNFIVKPSKMKCFVNPTQSNYIFYKNMYINEDDERATEEYKTWLQKQITSQTEIIVNDSLVSLSLPFQIVNDLFIEKTKYNWDYHLDESIPANVTLQNAVVTRRNRALANDPNYQAGKFQTVKSKIFREEDFLAYLKESGVEANISFPQNKIPFNELPKVKMAEINLDSIACPPGRQALESALEHWDKWLTLKGADFEKEYEDYISVTRQKELKPSLENECYREYGGDYSYKQAASKFSGVINPLYNLSFFIVE